MKRFILSLLIAAPLGCSTTESWITACDKDPDLRINIWESNDANKASNSADKTKAAETTPK